MSYNPIACLREPDNLQCIQQDRKCPNQPFFYQVEHPPWYHYASQCPVSRKPLERRAEYDYELTYDFQADYMPANKQHRVEPLMAYWYYCDHIPDLPSKSNGKTSHKQVGPWPPISQGVCPPPVECEPCGPGPWANPDARKFFYIDCD